MEQVSPLQPAKAICLRAENHSNGIVEAPLDTTTIPELSSGNTRKLNFFVVYGRSLERNIRQCNLKYFNTKLHHKLLQTLNY